MLPTTTVGSFPKPDYLTRARAQYRRGKISSTELHELELQATREIIRLQEDIGLDILVHGEMERGDMTTYFAELLDGYAISGLVRSYGNRYYRKPIVTGEIRRPRAMTVEMFKYAQSLTDKPVKGMLTGAYTMCDWSFNEYYPSRREVVLAVARVMHGEVKDLEHAGAHFTFTQPLYELDVLEKFLDRLGQRRIPIFLGLLPLMSYRHAQFLHNEVPGITIPESHLAAMKKAGERGADVGIELCQELLYQAQHLVDGIYLMPSFGRYETCLEVVKAFLHRRTAEKEAVRSASNNIPAYKL